MTEREELLGILWMFSTGAKPTQEEIDRLGRFIIENTKDPKKIPALCRQNEGG